jgi:hypothetical protein
VEVGWGNTLLLLSSLLFLDALRIHKTIDYVGILSVTLPKVRTILSLFTY